MPIAPWLLLTTLVAPLNAAQSGPAFRPASEIPAIQAAVTTWRDGVAPAVQGRSPATTSGSQRPHRFGLGGTFGVSNRGAGGAFRYWFGERVGLGLTASWYRGPKYTTTGTRSSSFQGAPSLLVMLTRPDATRDIDIRPYVGGGLSYTRANTPYRTS